MAIVDNAFYTGISDSLEKVNNSKNHRYMYGIRTQGNSPLDPVVPLFTQFFGPKVLSIVIVSKNYGFESGVLNWPQSTIDVQIDTIKQSFVNWVQYKVYYYVDFVLANTIVGATPDSQYLDQMETVKGKITELCAQMGDFGFEYKEDLREGKDAAYFQPLIDEFWK